MEVIEARGEAATEAIGASLWKTLQAPACILLDAPMGTGKTALVRGMLRQAGHTGDVPSPTFAIVQPYETDPPLYHVDLYRLNSPSELAELGIGDMLDVGILAVEWPERGEGWPSDAILVRGLIREDGVRQWTVQG